MHYLKVILVDLSKERHYYEGYYKDLEKDELIVIAKRNALKFLDKFKDKWFDWREDNAGRWIDKYPNSCLTGRYDKEQFIEEVMKIKDQFITNIVSIFNLREFENTIISKDGDKLIINLSKDLLTNKLKDLTFGELMDMYVVKKLIKIMDGEMIEEVPLMNTIEETCYISDKLLSDILANPEKYALVYIDIHV